MKNIITKTLFIMGLVFFLSSSEAFAQAVLTQQSLNGIIAVESSGQVGTVQAGTTAAGLTQINAATMVNDGFATFKPGINPQGNLCSQGCCGSAGNLDTCLTYTLPAQYGVTDAASYLANADAQLYTGSTDLQGRINFLNQSGLANSLGTTVNGVQITQSSLLECANLGVGNCQTFINTGVDPTGGQMVKAMNIANNATGDNFALSPAGAAQGNSLTSITDSASGLYCDPAVLSMIQTQGAQVVNARLALATDYRTGYSMLGGEGVLSAAGLGPSPSTTFIGGPTGSFRQMSCIDRLLSAGSLDILFNPPSLAQLLNMLMNIACQKAAQLMASVTQPLKQSLYQNANLNGFMPGWGLGSLGGGISTGYQQGQSGGINIGTTALNGNVTNNIYNGSTGQLFSSTPSNMPTQFNGRLFP
jgi:hypothetical protein